jgi:seryl-tRNA synthetase
VDKALALDEKRRQLITQTQEVREARNRLNDQLKTIAHPGINPRITGVESNAFRT